MNTIRRAPVAIAEADLENLRARIAATRWVEEETVDDWSQGPPLAVMRELADCWAGSYDWRACEARINAFDPCVTEIDGLDIHFLHARSPHADALPLVITHGWPGSIAEFLDVIPMLTNPTAFGGRAEDAFHVVAPSLPGYGFSGKPTKAGWNAHRIANAWAVLMARLGYGARWGAQGGDWGSVVTTIIGALAPPGLVGVHTNRPMYRPKPGDREVQGAEFDRMRALDNAYRSADAGYMHIQKSRPQTIGYALVDSPVAQAAWIYEKLWKWTDHDGDPAQAICRDRMLDNIALYWLTASGGSSARLYWEAAGTIANSDLTVQVPSGASIFPAEISYTPREWASRVLTNLVYWNEAEKGGHFAAWEQPAIFAREVRACFALMR